MQHAELNKHSLIPDLLLKCSCRHQYQSKWCCVWCNSPRLSWRDCCISSLVSSNLLRLSLSEFWPTSIASLPACCALARAAFVSVEESSASASASETVLSASAAGPACCQGTFSSQAMICSTSCSTICHLAAQMALVWHSFWATGGALRMFIRAFYLAPVFHLSIARCQQMICALLLQARYPVRRLCET